MFSTRFLAPVVILVVALCGLSASAVSASTFDVRGGDLNGLIRAMHNANANGQDDTINLSGRILFSAASNSIYGPTGLPVIKNDGALTINHWSAKNSHEQSLPDTLHFGSFLPLFDRTRGSQQ